MLFGQGFHLTRRKWRIHRFILLYEPHLIINKGITERRKTVLVVEFTQQSKVVVAVLATPEEAASSIDSRRNSCRNLLNHEHKQKLQFTSTYVDHRLLFGGLQLFLWFHFVSIKEREALIHIYVVTAC